MRDFKIITVKTEEIVPDELADIMNENSKTLRVMRQEMRDGFVPKKIWCEEK